MYIFALYLLIHKLMKQTNLKYLMIGVLTIASISCMDKERDLSWERSKHSVTCVFVSLLFLPTFVSSLQS